MTNNTISKHPALAAARIWAIVIATGPLLFMLLNWLYQLKGSPIPLLQVGEPDYFQLYTTLLIAGAFLALIPFFITWAMLAFWKQKRLPARMMSERLVLLALLFTVVGILFLMGQIGTQRPLKNAMLLLLPYFFAGALAILRVLGWPWPRG